MICLLLFAAVATAQDVAIGSHVWAKENLNVGVMIPLSQPSTNNGIVEKYCYGNLEANCSKLGAFYAWDELMAYNTVEGNQGLCPDGYHVGTKAEWQDLLSAVGVNSAIKLKALTTWKTGPFPGTDEFGFAFVGSGYGYPGTATPTNGYEGQWAQAGTFGYSWTSTMVGETPTIFAINNAGYKNGQSNGGFLFVYKDGVKRSYLPVRCVKND